MIFVLNGIRFLQEKHIYGNGHTPVPVAFYTKLLFSAKRVFLEPPDRSTESHWRAAVRASGAVARAIESNPNTKSHLSQEVTLCI